MDKRSKKYLQEKQDWSQDYLQWVGQAGLKPLTRSQYTFAQWLLKNKKKVGQLGDLETIFTSVRQYLRK